MNLRKSVYSEKKNIVLKILESYKEIKRREERIRDNLEKLILIIPFVKWFNWKRWNQDKCNIRCKERYF